MDSSSYYTSADNFISAVQGSVDPRTGFFNIQLPLGKHTCQQTDRPPVVACHVVFSPVNG